MIDGEEKFIWGSDGRNGLFDLAVDPLETRNLVEEKPGRAAELQQELGEFHRSLQLCSDTPAPVEELTEEQRELLKSLGYLD
jgi:hypothetical protein